ncbi:hypothetical protein G5C60_17430 [Streptomyces sp. HC44]|uniref:Uncharacterized protein n=1 Tax=Streptomyces scabichelini TaxID=2711217 RepID=A0A6G4V5S6_9ACTN|nr:hypothetical protein [Streptomyces scabichelini]NGO09331.1 hypothetical protein [Streptomyces scabichelini]
MRLLTLYLRSRQVPVAAAAVTAGVAVVALLGNDSEDPLQTLLFAVLALGLGLGVFGNGLGGADPALERTAATRWVYWRMAHVGAIAAAVFAVAVATSGAPTGTILRDTAGLAGLTALAAALFGHQLAWTLPTMWAGAAAVLPARTEPEILRVLTWPVQSPDSTFTTVVAAVLAVIGLTAYAARGSRPTSPDHQSRLRTPTRSQ